MISSKRSIKLKIVDLYATDTPFLGLLRQKGYKKGDVIAATNGADDVDICVWCWDVVFTEHEVFKAEEIRGNWTLITENMLTNGEDECMYSCFELI